MIRRSWWCKLYNVVCLQQRALCLLGRSLVWARVSGQYHHSDLIMFLPPSYHITRSLQSDINTTISFLHTILCRWYRNASFDSENRIALYWLKYYQHRIMNLPNEWINKWIYSTEYISNIFLTQLHLWNVLAKTDISIPITQYSTHQTSSSISKELVTSSPVCLIWLLYFSLTMRSG